MKSGAASKASKVERNRALVRSLKQIMSTYSPAKSGLFLRAASWAASTDPARKKEKEKEKRGSIVLQSLTYRSAKRFVLMKPSQAVFIPLTGMWGRCKHRVSEARRANGWATASNTPERSHLAGPLPFLRSLWDEHAVPPTAPDSKLRFSGSFISFQWSPTWTLSMSVRFRTL